MTLSRRKNTISRSFWQGSFISTFTFYVKNHKICKMVISLTSTLGWVARPGPKKNMEEQTKKKTKDVHDGNRRHSCKQCNYSTAEAGNLKKHKLIHSGEKPFACSQCKYSCTTVGNLKAHLLIHTGENPFKCRQCDYSCKQASNLKRHILTHHTYPETGKTE